MELTDALQSLMALFVEHISMLSADITACIKSKVTDWDCFTSQVYTGIVCRYQLGKLR